MKLFHGILAMILLLVLPVTVSAYALPEGETPCYCISPFSMDHTVTGEGGAAVYSGVCYPRVFRLTSGETSLPVYSLDPAVGVRQEATYVRKNLEDAWDQETAGRLRAVVLHTFPWVSLPDLQTQANAWLRKQGLPELRELQSGEAVLATQAALWNIVGGEGETIHSLYAGVVENPDVLGDAVVESMAYQQPTSHTAENVESLYTYLCTLPGEAVRGDVACASSLEAPTYSWVHTQEGYTLTVLVTVNTAVGPQDNLCLTAICGDQVQSQMVTQPGGEQFVFQGMERVQPVTLRLTGEQWGGDVYLFTGEDAQPFIGYDDSCQSVYGEITVNPGRSPASAPVSQETDLGVQLDVGRLGSHSASFAVGDTHTWTIRTNVPQDMGPLCQYQVTAVLDSRLDYRSGSPTVRLYTRAGTPVLLRREDHYVLEEVDDNFFRVTLTPAGMAYAGAHLGEGEQDPELHIRFLAAINDHAAMGDPIPNVAHFAYTDALGNLWEMDSGIAQVYTGGVLVYNTDAEGTAIPGTVYSLARLATVAEKADPNVETTLLNIEEEIYTAVYVPFYSSDDLQDGQVWEVTTDEQGQARFFGLPYGDYYLVQRKPSDGYILTTRPIPVTIDGSSHTQQGREEVVNAKIVLPQTGGTGAELYRLFGLLLLGSAGFLLAVNRRRK